MKNYWIILLSFTLRISTCTATENNSPNVVLIYMDDMGYGDLSVFGALRHTTPNLDEMARNGMRFTNFLAPQAVCTASRAGLLTGCYPNRIGMAGALFPNSPKGLNPEETTLAEMFKQKGYSTAIFGKWHLGDQKEFLPLQHGFDEYVGIPYSNDMWPFDYLGKKYNLTKFQESCPPLPIIYGNEKKGEINTMDDQSQLTRIFTDNATDFIKRNTEKPFFLYLPHPMPHVPIAASDRFRGKSKSGVYGDVIMEIDWSVGEIIRTLKEEGLDSNTLVIFTSDNGPWRNFGNHAGSSCGLREAKQTVFEGGLRVPCIMMWKGKVTEGIICNKLSSSIDILPTLANICDLQLPENRIDGVDLFNLLKGKNDVSPRKHFYYYYNQNSLKAVRLDDWKLILPHPSKTDELDVPGKDGLPGRTSQISVPLGLYDLRHDPSERYDVQELYPEIVEELQKLADSARQDLGDDLTEAKGKNRRVPGFIEL